MCDCCRSIILFVMDISLYLFKNKEIIIEINLSINFKDMGRSRDGTDTS
jgi:hypothetical protein